MKPSSCLLLSRMLKKLKASSAEIDKIYEMLEEKSKRHEPQIELLESIPGIGRLSAMYIIAEISADMPTFPTSRHIASWAGLAQKDIESAGKLKSPKTKKANVYVKSILTECAWAATKTRGNRLSNWYWKNQGRLGQKKR
ncbi:MAG: IS110 family transposase [Eubacteriaceae bacterium]|nr:IS110 family transposase [Eubacteriaceae bacterium]